MLLALTTGALLGFAARPAAPAGSRARAPRMGVSDRMAVDGLLYEAWGAEGMRVLNRTTTLQLAAEELKMNRYEQVLVAAVRAKENAYQSADEAAYIGSAFGGSMGSGVRKALPAKSHVVGAIEELCDEVAATGELPRIDAFLDDVEYAALSAERAAEEATAEAEAAADAEEQARIDAALLADLGQEGMEGIDPQMLQEVMDGVLSAEGLSPDFDDDDFDDEIALELGAEPAPADDAAPADDLAAELFGGVAASGEAGALEAGAGGTNAPGCEG